MKKARNEVISKRLFVLGEKTGIGAYFRRGNRLRDCASQLEFEACPECGIRKLTRANFCRDRLCPVCQWRRSRALATKLKNKMQMLGVKGRLIFLTLTVRNVEWGRLRETLGDMAQSWGRMTKVKRFKAAVRGWARTLEITRGRDGLAHPHYHVLLLVPTTYFRTQYITQEEFVTEWGKALRVDYLPSVDIRAVKKGREEEAEAINEVCKYITKSDDVEGLNDDEFLAYVRAIHGVRFWATGGELRMSEEKVDAAMMGEEQEHEEKKCTCPICGGATRKETDIWRPEWKRYLPSGVNITTGAGTTINIYVAQQRKKE